ncbi:MAG: response regulator [Chlorobi bacterium]|nr:response regulator [Chlorobiota bacterium]
MIRSYLRKAFGEGTMISDFNLRSAALLGAPAQISFYFLFKYVFGLPYENAAIRFAAALLSFSVLFRKQFPEQLQKYFPYYWHFSIIFVLPFIFTFYLLMNNFHELWLYWEIFMLFILITYVPNWLIFLVDLFIGVAAAILMFLLLSNGMVLDPRFDIPLYSIVIFFTVAAGYIFSYSNKKGQLALEKNAALQALAVGIAHEMRNPLGQVRYNLDAIQDELPAYHAAGTSRELSEDALGKLYAGIAQGQMAVNRGVQVIDMILEEVRNEDPFRSGSTYLSAVAVTRKALDEYGYEADEERWKVHFSSENDFMFKGVESMYVFVIFNLVMNALYFLRLDPKGGIFINTALGERFNSVIVRDTGPGISKENLTRIFDPFFTSGKKGGTGLGLAYCKRVMRLFGGDITCQSVQGEYTEFTLSFPVICEEELFRFEEQLFRDNREIFIGKRLLLADHDTAHRGRIAGFLWPLGVEIDTAGDGGEVLEKMSTGHYDLLLCEMELPVNDGYKLASLLNSGQEIQSVPVVVYSGEPSYLYSGRAEKSGIAELISRPIMLQPLLSALSSALTVTSTRVASRDLSEKNVLLVDDSSVNRVAVKGMLHHIGIDKVVEASNGIDALEILERMQLDLLLLDIQMPVLDGLEVAKRVRQGSSANRMVPIVAMSGESDSTIIEDAIRSGMNAYLVKPVDRLLMQQKILQVI